MVKLMQKILMKMMTKLCFIPSTWFDVLPEFDKDVLPYAIAVNRDHSVVSYLRDVKQILQFRDLKTDSLLHHFPLGIGTVSQISARRKYSNLFVGFTSFLDPGNIYECDLSTDVPEMKIFREITIPGLVFREFVIDQLWISVLLCNMRCMILIVIILMLTRAWLFEPG